MRKPKNNQRRKYTPSLPPEVREKNSRAAAVKRWGDPKRRLRKKMLVATAISYIDQFASSPSLLTEVLTPVLDMIGEDHADQVADYRTLPTAELLQRRRDVLQTLDAMIATGKSWDECYEALKRQGKTPALQFSELSELNERSN